jgi:transposase
MDKITTVGLDLAKLSIAVHVVDARGQVVMRKVLRREALLRWSATLPPCQFAMEACGGAHHWARELLRQGHQVRIIAAEFVKPFRKSGKNDANDAEAMVAPLSPEKLRRELRHCLDDEQTNLPHTVRQLVRDELVALDSLEQRIDAYMTQIAAQVRDNVAAKRLQAIAGVGTLTAAATVATVSH